MCPLQAHCHHGLGTLYARIGQQEQAHAALSTAIAMYRTMEMTFWLPQAEATLAQKVEQRSQREEFLEALPSRSAYGRTKGSAQAPGTAAPGYCGKRLSSSWPMIDTKGPSGHNRKPGR